MKVNYSAVTPEIKPSVPALVVCTKIKFIARQTIFNIIRLYHQRLVISFGWSNTTDTVIRAQPKVIFRILHNGINYVIGQAVLFSITGKTLSMRIESIQTTRR